MRYFCKESNSLFWGGGQHAGVRSRVRHHQSIGARLSTSPNASDHYQLTSSVLTIWPVMVLLLGRLAVGCACLWGGVGNNFDESGRKIERAASDSDKRLQLNGRSDRQPLENAAPFHAIDGLNDRNARAIVHTMECHLRAIDHVPGGGVFKLAAEWSASVGFVDFAVCSYATRETARESRACFWPIDDRAGERGIMSLGRIS